MKKGQNKRVWTPEQKAEIVYKHLNDHISLRSLEKEYHADRGMICKWVKKYIAEGESSFVHKGHPGNPFAALHVSKNLSEVERLRLTVAKLEVENERLRQHRTIAEASAVGSPIRQETIGFPAHFFARAHNFKPPGRACQPEADSPMRT